MVGTGKGPNGENALFPITSEARRDLLEKMGLVFGPTFSPQLFLVWCSLPEGWSVLEPDRRWSKLLDEQGRVRALILSDRHRWDDTTIVTILPRIQIDFEEDGPAVTAIVRAARGNGASAELFRSLTYPYESDDQWNARFCRRNSYIEVEQWLRAQYPEWQDPLAYWDLSFRSDARF